MVFLKAVFVGKLQHQTQSNRRSSTEISNKIRWIRLKIIHWSENINSPRHIMGFALPTLTKLGPKVNSKQAILIRVLFNCPTSNKLFFQNFTKKLFQVVCHFLLIKVRWFELLHYTNNEARWKSEFHSPHFFLDIWK